MNYSEKIRKLLLEYFHFNDKHKPTQNFCDFLLEQNLGTEYSYENISQTIRELKGFVDELMNNVKNSEKSFYNNLINSTTLLSVEDIYILGRCHYDGLFLGRCREQATQLFSMTAMKDHLNSKYMLSLVLEASKAEETAAAASLMLNECALRGIQPAIDKQYQNSNINLTGKTREAELVNLKAEISELANEEHEGDDIEYSYCIQYGIVTTQSSYRALMVLKTILHNFIEPNLSYPGDVKPANFELQAAKIMPLLWRMFECCQFLALEKRDELEIYTARAFIEDFLNKISNTNSHLLLQAQMLVVLAKLDNLVTTDKKIEADSNGAMNQHYIGNQYLDRLFKLMANNNEQIKPIFVNTDFIRAFGTKELLDILLKRAQIAINENNDIIKPSDEALEDAALLKIEENIRMLTLYTNVHKLIFEDSSIGFGNITVDDMQKHQQAEKYIVDELNVCLKFHAKDCYLRLKKAIHIFENYKEEGPEAIEHKISLVRKVLASFNPLYPNYAVQLHNKFKITLNNLLLENKKYEMQAAEKLLDKEGISPEEKNNILIWLMETYDSNKAELTALQDKRNHWEEMYHKNYPIFREYRIKNLKEILNTHVPKAMKERAFNDLIVLLKEQDKSTGNIDTLKPEGLKNYLNQIAYSHSSLYIRIKALEQLMGLCKKEPSKMQGYLYQLIYNLRVGILHSKTREVQKEYLEKLSLLYTSHKNLVAMPLPMLYQALLQIENHNKNKDTGAGDLKEHFDCQWADRKRSKELEGIEGIEGIESIEAMNGVVNSVLTSTGTAKNGDTHATPYFKSLFVLESLWDSEESMVCVEPVECLSETDVTSPNSSKLKKLSMCNLEYLPLLQGLSAMQNDLYGVSDNQAKNMKVRGHSSILR